MANVFTYDALSLRAASSKVKWWQQDWKSEDALDHTENCVKLFKVQICAKCKTMQSAKLYHILGVKLSWKYCKWYIFGKPWVLVQQKWWSWVSNTKMSKIQYVSNSNYCLFFFICDVALVTRPEHLKTAKDEVKQARRAQNRSEGPPTRSGF